MILTFGKCIFRVFQLFTCFSMKHDFFGSRRDVANNALPSQTCPKVVQNRDLRAHIKSNKMLQKSSKMSDFRKNTKIAGGSKLEAVLGMQETDI